MSKINSYKLLSANDVAQLLNISRSLVYQLIQHGKIPVVQINSVYRIRPEDLELYIQNNLSSPLKPTTSEQILYEQ